ncbi:MAG: TPM domain-containing protein [Chromatiales bacterium]|jgi:uncharacterized protein|nr:TPM domain-containing protein [Chromatiales bacterium]
MTRKFPYLFSAISLVLLIALRVAVAPAHSTLEPIPAFTPNVVDTAVALSPAEIGEINAALQEVRDQADILGAVYIVDSLQGEAIESLAERTFSAWALGQQGVDNGLLLVLAMQEHKSRFEVGYGLEGELSDLIASQALTSVLAPHMRRGEIKSGIIRSFFYVTDAKSGSAWLRQEVLPDVQSDAADVQPFSPDMESLRSGLIAWAVYAGLLWMLPMAIHAVQLSKAQRLEREDPAYRVSKDASLNFGRFSLKHWFVKSGFLVFFLMVNPGAFVFVAGWLGWAGALWGMVGLLMLIGWLCCRVSVNRYTSMTAYLDWLHEQAANARSSSSSSSRSSLGGGRSGGGGASGMLVR